MRTSRGRWTNDAATQSTPSSSPSARSLRSLSVSGEMGSTASGMLTPLWFEISPPILTRTPAKFAPHVSTSSLILPSLTRRLVPGFSAVNTSGWGSATRSELPGAGSRSRTNDAPSSSTALPSASSPIRSFGPCRSSSTPMGRPAADSVPRIASKHRRWPSWSPWLKFSRNTSTPAANSARIVSGADVAGPRVAMILAKRCRRIRGSAADGAGCECGRAQPPVRFSSSTRAWQVVERVERRMRRVSFRAGAIRVSPMICLTSSSAFGCTENSRSPIPRSSFV